MSALEMIQGIAAQAASIIGQEKPMKKAAGILFVTEGGKVLLGKRANYGDYPGYWGCFGGHQEPGETDELTAIRECLEETGHGVIPVEMVTPKGEVVLPPPLQSIAKTITDGTEFTYFVNVCKPFDVVINDEHTDYGWFSMGDLPDGPLHPGMLDVLNMPEFKSLRMTKMHETDIARAVANNALPSPTKFANMSFYRMRITGTGTAFRRGSEEEVDKNGKVTRKKVQDEFVYRHPDNYLTPDFLDRCNGLPLIFEHPKKKVLDSKEFSNRMIGVIVCPYIVDDEVWGVAKVYDDDSVLLLDNEKMSTSPTVVFHDRSENHTIALNDGSVLLIEGRPSLLDHLAVCAQGVWDKGGEPAGVESELAIADAVNPEKPNGASEMSEAEDKAKADAEEKAKADAAAKADSTPPAWADAFMKRMDAVESLFKNHKADADEKAKADAKADADEKARCDAEEKAKADAEEKEKKEAAEKAEKDKPAETAADKKADEEAKAKADAEEKEKADAKADSARKDKQLADMARRLDALTGAVHISDADRVQLAEIQSRADTVENAFGGRASAPVPGETPVAYRKRLAAKFKTHSKAWVGEDVGALSDSVLAIAEQQIYADALAASSSPADVPAGTLREIIKIDRVGRKISEFVGAKSAWMDQFKSPAQLQVRINKELH
jgi:8-oxo-dGTP pyrophosphatase MutT (NUDIX family)